MNPTYDQYEQKREALVRQTNANNIPMFNPVVFKKTKDERHVLRVNKLQHKVLVENKALYNEKRSEVISQISKAPIPNWGNITLNLL